MAYRRMSCGALSSNRAPKGHCCHCQLLQLSGPQETRSTRPSRAISRSTPMHESTREQPPCGRYLSVGAIALLLLGGCSDLLGVRSKEFGGVKSAAVLAQYRLVTVRPRQAESTPANVTCTEPNPDVALAISGALSASAKSTAGASADVAAQYGESIAPLGKRYATVSILSTMLFSARDD